MKVNFDEVIDRRNTNSLKFDFVKEWGKPEGVLPMWVADMDFRIPEEVTEELLKVAEFGVYGYTMPKDDYYKAVTDWFWARHGWKTDRRQIVLTPGVVFAICTAIRAFTEKGDAVLICEPVYYPFRQSVENNDRRVVNSELVYKNGKYYVDFDDFERKIVENDVKMFILCSPHNPVGRVWTKDELVRMGEICLKHDVLVVSDEIHCDFVFEGHKHVAFASISERFAENSVVCTAPSKTFNLAGIQSSNIFIKNANLRHKYKRALAATGYGEPNTFAITACRAAYKKGDKWLCELLEYLKGNLDFAREFIKDIDGVELVEPEGTYLIWLDCSGLGLGGEELESFVLNKAGLWLDGGVMFGEKSKQFQRINLTCPRSVLKEGLQRLKIAVEDMKQEL